MSPATKLRSDATGRGVPVGHAVRYDGAVGAVAVMLATTAVGGTAERGPGIPAAPATCTVSVPFAPTFALGAPVPALVSTKRVGAIASNPDPTTSSPESSVNQPPTSAIRWSAPAGWNSATRPLVPTLTITRFPTERPGVTFRFEARGRGAPLGLTVTYVGALAEVAVTLSTTAETPSSGMPPRPVTWRSSTCPADGLAAGAPIPVRVSRIRSGAAGRCSPPGSPATDGPTQPATSATKCTAPAALNNDTRPLLPTPTCTRLGRVSPARTLRFDANGRVCPAGQTVT